MSSPRNIGRQALADFFRAMVAHKAHWYSILIPEDQVRSRIHAVFPPLSELLSIDVGIMKEVFKVCGLLYTRGKVSSPLLKAWEEFLVEYQVDAEITTFSIERRKRFFIRIGSWHKLHHPVMMPIELWRSKSGLPPEVQLLEIKDAFARAVGKMSIELTLANSFACKSDSDRSESSDNDDNQVVEDVSKSEDAISTVLDPNQFPLLHKLGVNTDVHMDRLIQEILKLHGNQEIRFTRGNNREGTLVALPSHRTLERSESDLSKNNSVIDLIVNNIMKNVGCSIDDAVESFISAICKKYEESYISVGIERNIIKPSKKMDAISVEAMLQDACVNRTNARSLFRHIHQFFGKDMFESEKRRREIFGNNDFPPTVDKHVLEDKTVIPYWYKDPEQLIKHQISHIVPVNKLSSLTMLDIAVGGDHGGGKFRMSLKLNFRFSNTTISHLFQIASVSYSKDDMKILKKVVIDPIGNGLRVIAEGGRFAVKKDASDKLEVSFSGDDLGICNVPTRLVLVGDLKFYAQMSGRDGMSSSWCMWCQLHPSEWKTFFERKDDIPAEQQQHWTIEKLKEQKEKIIRKELKTPKQIKGVVDFPIWDFINIENFIFLQLHFEIGVVNMVLDNLYSFIEDQVEVLSPEEKVGRNNVIIANVTLEEAKEKLMNWTANREVDLEMYRMEKCQLNHALRSKNTPRIELESLNLEKLELENRIAALVRERKELEVAVSEKRKAVTAAKKELKIIHEKKKKVDTPVSADVENILIEYNICAAAYHGGKLNGVDCREFIRLNKEIFARIQALLLTFSHPDRCYDNDIVKACEVHRDIAATLDVISSKLRLKYKEPKEEDYLILDRALLNLDYLWKVAGLSYTPKVHSILAHAVQQMKRFEGIGDMLEDDVERIHQIAAKIESRVSRIKNKNMQAFAHSKIEAVQNNQEVKEKITESMLKSKRNFKKRHNNEAFTRAVKAKVERDYSRMESLESIEEKPHDKLALSFLKSI